MIVSHRSSGSRSSLARLLVRPWPHTNGGAVAEDGCGRGSVTAADRTEPVGVDGAGRPDATWARQTLAVPPKRLLGPAARQPPRLDDERTERTGDELDDHDLLEDVEWTGGAPGSVTGVEIVRSRLTGITLTGLELADLRLLDVELVECELSGAVLTGARWERVVLRRCRMSGLVAAELQAVDVRLAGLQGRSGLAPRRRCSTAASSSTPTCRAPTSTARASRGRRSGAATSPRSTCPPPSSSRCRCTARRSTGSRGPSRCSASRSAATSSCRSRCRSWPPASITVDDDAPDLVDGS